MTKNPTLSVQSLGGIPNFEREVSITGSTHMVTCIGKKQQEIRIVLDMGAFGTTNSTILDQLKLQGLGDLNTIDALVISHVHNDHIGYLIDFIKAGYRGLIYMSHTSKALIVSILKDMIRLLNEQYETIQGGNTRFGKKANRMLRIKNAYDNRGSSSTNKSHSKHSKSKEKPTKPSKEEYQEACDFLTKYEIQENSDIKKHYIPLPETFYDEADIRQLLSQIRSFDTDENFEIINKEGCIVALKFYKAGHVPGATQTVLKFNPDPSNKKANFQVLYTGDLGRSKEPRLVDPPEPVKEKLDLTIMESTYGNRIHPERESDENELVNSINESKDMFLIPAFSLGRSVEVLKLILDRMERGEIILGTGEKIFVDGVLTKAIANELLLRYPEQYNFLTNPKIEFIDSQHHRKKIYNQQGRKIVIASGGMLQGGSSVPIAHKYMSKKNTVIATVGYQAYGTRGHYLQHNSGLVYNAARFKQMKAMLYDPSYTINRIVKRDLSEPYLISGQGTKELYHILTDLYTHRDAINLGDNEKIYVPARFRHDEERNDSIIKKTKTQLEQHDPDVYNFIKDKIVVIDEEGSYDKNNDYLAQGGGIHIFRDRNGKNYLKAQMKHFSSFSGHADRDELISLAEQNNQKSGHTTLLVHGDEPARKQLQEHLEKNKKISGKIIVPALYDILTFDMKTGKMISHDHRREP